MRHPGSLRGTKHRTPQTVEVDNGPLLETGAELWYRRLAYSNYKDIQKLKRVSVAIDYYKDISLDSDFP